MAATNSLRKEGADIGAQIGKWVAARTAPFLPPWLIVGALGGAAALGHVHFEDNTAATAIMGATATAVTAATWQEASRRSPRLRGHATLSVAAATAYVTAGTVAGPLAGGVGTMYAIGGSALALSWNVRYALRNSAEAETSGGDKLLDMVGMAKANVVKGNVEGSRVDAVLQLEPGKMTAADAQNKAGLIASAAGIPATAVRMTADPDDHSRVTMSLVAQDVLKKPTPWPGPSAPGGSVAKPIVMGICEDGVPLEFYLPGDPDVPRNASHIMWAGMNGSGKSEGFTVMALEVLTRSDALLWVGDPSKGRQTLGDIAHGLDWMETTPKGVEAMLDALPHVIRARADKLGRLGYKQWVPECWTKHRIPLLVAHFEEAADSTVADNPNLKPIAQQARSAGVILSVSLQRASGTNVDTDVRSEFGTGFMFGCQKPVDATFVLNDETIEAGANPQAWKNSKPGSCYVQSPGRSLARWATPNRTFRLDPSEEARREIRELISLYKGIRATADPVTARAAGSAYAAYRANATARAVEERAGVPAPRTDVVSRDRTPEVEIVDEPSFAVAEGPRRYSDAELAAMTDEQLAAAVLASGADDDLIVDPDADLPELPEGAEGVTLGEPSPFARRELTEDEAYAELLALVDALEAAGHTQIGPRHITKQWTGRSRSWVSRTLNRLADEGRLRETQTAGRYDIVPADGYAA
ncbi:hypothetical protein LO772_24505 [Yinghuangia sp. ASG 101]|uniref:hypothetical protein n=1 Tax=Yinghuangia sp. ASG 101 TaxID=2896848 RepID=UPI001E563AED|nr:hypothetical protein [Yinghuangia sp. ASG 101]UGQ10031.1 hypothetical protein LO772_24505 [Yinghuangia sp. ASG 101]